jgi:hypothetical protein
MEQDCFATSSEVAVRTSQQACFGMAAKAEATDGIGNSTNNSTAVQYRQRFFMC